MKKLFSFVMALVLALSLAVTAFADEETGSITITNATKNHSYSLYKIFDASYAVDEDGETLVDENGGPVIAYSITTDNQFFSYMFGSDGKQSNAYFEYDRHSKRQKRNGNEIGIHSIRGGTIVGEHSVMFAGNDEIVTISHSARSRAIFATGAVNAAVYLTDKENGMYNMSDLVNA
jgi:hypothetical protein